MALLFIVILLAVLMSNQKVIYSTGLNITELLFSYLVHCFVNFGLSPYSYIPQSLARDFHSASGSFAVPS